MSHIPPPPSAPELDHPDPNTTNPSPITTADPITTTTTTTTSPGSDHRPTPTANTTTTTASASTAPHHDTNTTTTITPNDLSDRPRKRRRRSSSDLPHLSKHQPKRSRAAADASTNTSDQPSMRLSEQGQHNHEQQRTRPSTANGSSNSQNGSSPSTAHSTTNGSTTTTNGSAHTNGDAVSRPQQQQQQLPFYGHDREEVTRILLQSLSDLGYHQAARQLSNESGYELEIASVAAFRSAVLHGEWEEAELLLFGGETGGGSGGGVEDGGVMLGNGHHSSSKKKSSRTSFGSQNGFAKHGLPLAANADTTMIKFMLRQQKYLELLEDRDLNSALTVLRSELTPLKKDVGRLHALSSLMMCQSAEDLRQHAEWDGAEGESRSSLLSNISKSISPSVMIPEHRLATLFSSVQDDQILNCRYHNTTAQPSLYTDHECSADDFPSQTLVELKNHTDEVWYLDFSHDGSMLATAGKDGLVCVYNTSTWRLQAEFREHDRNTSSSTTAQDNNSHNNNNTKGVTYVAFSPNDRYLISCSVTNELVVVDVHKAERVAVVDHFDYPVTTAAWLPDSHHFVVGTQAYQRPLGLYSLSTLVTDPTAKISIGVDGPSNATRNNELHSWRDPPWDHRLKENPQSFRVTDCAVNAAGTRLVATAGTRVMLYDLTTPSRAKIADWSYEDKLTSVNFGGEDDSQLLVNMNEGRVLALSASTGEILMRYEGAKQAEYVIRSRFGGAGGNFVVSGSEDSRVYVWRRQTGVPVAVLEAHEGTVNAVAWGPGLSDGDRGVWASAGDDRRVRIWSSPAAIRASAAAGPTETGGAAGGGGSGSTTTAARMSLGSYTYTTR